jgi:hypothetical protein
MRVLSVLRCTWLSLPMINDMVMWMLDSYISFSATHDPISTTSELQQ